jgi:hypothetical protein
MTVHRRETTARSLLAAVAAVAIVTVAGCGNEPRRAADANAPGSASASVSSAAGVARDLVRIRYQETTDSGESEVTEVIADGNRRYRITILSGPDAGYFMVWDGVAILMHVPHEEPSYTREEHPGKDEFPVSTFFYTEGTDEFRQTCPNARRLGLKTLYGRSAVRYACDKVDPGETAQVEPMEAREIALDEQTGLMLVNGPYVPIEVTFGPPIKGDTFSTKLPPGNETTELPPGAETTESGGIGSFRVPAVGGGYLAAASYQGKPLVVVTGPADGLRSAFGRLLPMTAGGSKPAVIGLLIAVPPSDWKGSLLNPADAKAFTDSVAKAAGRFAVPVGIDVKGAASYSITGGEPGQPGFETLVSIALVKSDGTLARVTPAGKATDAQLRNWLAELS